MLQLVDTRFCGGILEKWPHIKNLWYIYNKITEIYNNQQLSCVTCFKKITANTQGVNTEH